MIRIYARSGTGPRLYEAYTVFDARSRDIPIKALALADRPARRPYVRENRKIRYDCHSKWFNPSADPGDKKRYIEPVQNLNMES